MDLFQHAMYRKTVIFLCALFSIGKNNFKLNRPAEIWWYVLFPPCRFSIPPPDGVWHSVQADTAPGVQISDVELCPKFRMDESRVSMHLEGTKWYCLGIIVYLFALHLWRFQFDECRISRPNQEAEITRYKEAYLNIMMLVKYLEKPIYEVENFLARGFDKRVSFICDSTQANVAHLSLLHHVLDFGVFVLKLAVRLHDVGIATLVLVVPRPEIFGQVFKMVKFITLRAFNSEMKFQPIP